MKTIKVQELSKKAFRQYGSYQNLLDNEDLAEASLMKKGFFADLITLNFGGSTLPTVSVCNVKGEENNIIGFVEAHRNTCEGLLPLDADVIIFVGKVVRGELSPDTIEAFLVPRGTFGKMESALRHGKQCVTAAGEAHVRYRLPQRTYHNDMISKILGDNEKIEILA